MQGQTIGTPPFGSSGQPAAPRQPACRTSGGGPTSALDIRALVHPAGQANLLAGLKESAWGVTLHTQLQCCLQLGYMRGRSRAGPKAAGAEGER